MHLAAAAIALNAAAIALNAALPARATPLQSHAVFHHKREDAKPVNEASLHAVIDSNGVHLAIMVSAGTPEQQLYLVPTTEYSSLVVNDNPQKDAVGRTVTGKRATEMPAKRQAENGTAPASAVAASDATASTSTSSASDVPTSAAQPEHQSKSQSSQVPEFATWVPAAPSRTPSTISADPSATSASIGPKPSTAPNGFVTGDSTSFEPLDALAPGVALGNDTFVLGNYTLNNTMFTHAAPLADDDVGLGGYVGLAMEASGGHTTFLQRFAEAWPAEEFGVHLNATIPGTGASASTSLSKSEAITNVGTIVFGGKGSYDGQLTGYDATGGSWAIELADAHINDTPLLDATKDNITSYAAGFDMGSGYLTLADGLFERLFAALPDAQKSDSTHLILPCAANHTLSFRFGNGGRGDDIYHVNAAHWLAPLSPNDQNVFKEGEQCTALVRKGGKETVLGVPFFRTTFVGFQLADNKVKLGQGANSGAARAAAVSVSAIAAAGALALLLM